MSAHNHREFVDGCFRCDLSREEAKKYEESTPTTEEVEEMFVDLPPGQIEGSVESQRFRLWYTAEIAAAYRRGLETSLEILGAQGTSASYHGWKSADEEFMELQEKIKQEIQHPMLDRMTGDPKAEGRYDDEQ